MSGVQKREISEDEDGQRVDRWFFKHFPDVPKSHLFKLLRKGQIRVDSKRVKPDARLQTGQIVRVPPLQSKGEEGPKQLPVSAKEEAYYKSLVLYDDDDVLILNKPSGLAVQGGTGITQNLDSFLHIFENDKGVRPRLVHRLDKETSGVLMLARSAQSARTLGKAFKNQDVRKYYWAITSPAPVEKSGEIDAPLSKGAGGNKDKMLLDKKEGKAAKTLFETFDKASDQFAFVCFWPRTGRTHQIRVHSALMGAPVVGDEKYGGMKDFTNFFDTDQSIHPRLYLHARRIVCAHPEGKGKIDITAPLGRADKKLWEVLGFNADTQEDAFEEIEL